MTMTMRLALLVSLVSFGPLEDGLGAAIGWIRANGPDTEPVGRRAAPVALACPTGHVRGSEETIMSDENLEMPAPGMPQWIADHVKLYLSDPERAHMWDSTVAGGPGPLPTLLLIAEGAKTGKRRPLPLLYQEMDGGYVVIGSKGGAPQHPGWYVNLKANPQCEIRVGAKRMRARARTASGEERTKGWAKMVALYPPYEAYQQRAGSRQIPVVILEPMKE